MNREKLLSRLPAFRGEKKLIKREQSVSDIVDEVLNAHVAFAGHYDLIADLFEFSNPVDVLENIFDFVRKNVRYREESEHSQLTKSPAAILQPGSTNDCKCISLFVAGVLDALNRKGWDFDWSFAFAGYGSKKIKHVFVSVGVGGETFWVDPVLPEFDQRTPAPTFLKLKFPTMALHRLSGIGFIPDDGGSTLNKAAEAVRIACLTPAESIDEQLTRLSLCPQEKTYLPDVPIQDSRVLYDVANNTAVKVTAVTDSYPSEPGLPLTGQAPTGSAPSQAYELTDGSPGAVENNTGGGESFLKKNAVWIGAGALVLLLLLMKKRKK